MRLCKANGSRPDEKGKRHARAEYNRYESEKEDTKRKKGDVR